jgi:hypothetical protein
MQRMDVTEIALSRRIERGSGKQRNAAGYTQCKRT